MKYTDNYFADFEKLYTNNNDLNQLKNKTIFITGSTGLIGSALTDYLLFLNKKHNMNIKIYLGARDYEKLCQRFHIYKKGSDFYFVNYDACKKLEINISFNYIIHCAGNGDPAKIVNNPVETILANTNGLTELLQYAKEKSSEKLLYISSSEVYGINETDKPHVENRFGIIDPSNVRSCYPLSKKCGENLCVSFSSEYKLPVVIVRPGHIYGPQMTKSDSRATAQFFRNVVSGNDIVMKSDGMQLRSYCYSLDCASAILSVLLKGENAGAYNISNPASICTIKDFAQELAKLAGRSVVFETSSTAEKKSYNMMSNSSLDSTKLEFLGWRACFSLQEGIAETLQQLD